MISYWLEVRAIQKNVNREQLAAILWRYAQYKGCDVTVGEETNILSYTDVSKVSAYAIPAVQWARGAGITVMPNADGQVQLPA